MDVRTAHREQIVSSVGPVRKRLGHASQRRAAEARKPVGETVLLGHEEGVVAAEQFVASIAAESHLDVPRRELRNQIGRNRGGIGERFIEMIDQLGNQLDGVRVEHDFMVLRAESPRRQGRVGKLVVLRFLPADGEGSNGRRGLTSHGRHHQAGIDAPA